MTVTSNIFDDSTANGGNKLQPWVTAQSYPSTQGIARSTPATYFDANGNFQTAIANELRVDHDRATPFASRGNLLESTSTNYIRNVTAASGVAGSPGTEPNDWAFDPGTSVGLTRTIAYGTEQGIPYLEVTYVGTTTAAGTMFNNIVGGGVSTSAIGPAGVTLLGTQWTGSVYLRVTANTGLTNVQHGWFEWSSTSTFLAGHSTNVVPTSAALATQRFTRTATASGTGVANLSYAINFNYILGSVNFTVRIALPQMEMAATASSVITQSGAIPSYPAGNPRAADLSLIPRRVSNGGNAYQLTVPGTSSAGPSGTGSNITDGTCTWKYLGSIDYTSLAAWASTVPATLTQPLIAQVWNSGPLIPTAGASLLSLSGHTTSPTNTLTVKAAPGDSIRDSLKTQTIPLNFDVNQGVCVSLPNAVGGVNYINLGDANVIIDGIQFKDPNSASNCTIVGGTGTTPVVRNCLFDGFAQTGGAAIVGLDSGGTVYNCSIIDRQAAGAAGECLRLDGNSTFVNCTILNPNANTAGVALNTLNSPSAVRTRNCAIFGYATPFGTGTTTNTVDHCVLSAASISTSIDGGSNTLNALATNQFVSSTADLRLKNTSACLDAGLADATDIPTADDIAGTTRPQGAAWDIGAWELSAPGAASGTDLFFVLRTSANVSQFDPISSAKGNINFRAVATTSQFTNGTGLATFAALTSPSAVGQFNTATGLSSITISFSSGTSGSTVFASTPFSGIFNPSSTGASNNSISLSWLPPISQELPFFVGKASGTVISGIVSQSNLLFIMAMRAIGATSKFTNASEIASIPALAASASAQNLIYASLPPVTIEVITASATAAAPNGGTGQATFFVINVTQTLYFVTISAKIDFQVVGRASPVPVATAKNNINYFVSGTASKSTNASESANILTVRAISSAASFEFGSALDTFFVITSQIVSSLTASGSARLEVLTAAATLTQGLSATAIATIPTLSVAQLIGQLLLTEDGHNLAAESGLQLRVDIAILDVIQEDRSTTTVSLLSLAAVGAVTLTSSFTTATASANVDWQSTGNLMVPLSTNGAANIDFTLAGGLGPASTGLATFLQLSMFQPQPFQLLADPFGIPLFWDPVGPAIAAYADVTALNAIQEDLATQLASIMAMAAAVTGIVGNNAAAADNIDLAATGQIDQFTTGVGLASFAAVQAIGNAFIVGQFASNDLAIDYTVEASVSQSDPATASSNIDLAATGVLLQGNLFSGSGTLAFSATADAINAQDVVAVSSIPPLTVSGFAVINGHELTGMAAIVFAVQAATTGIAFGTATSTIGVIEKASGNLWVTPAGFVEGETVVYWPD